MIWEWGWLLPLVLTAVYGEVCRWAGYRRGRADAEHDAALHRIAELERERARADLTEARRP